MGVFLHFLIYASGTNSRKASHIVDAFARDLYTPLHKWNVILACFIKFFNTLILSVKTLVTIFPYVLSLYFYDNLMQLKSLIL